MNGDCGAGDRQWLVRYSVPDCTGPVMDCCDLCEDSCDFDGIRELEAQNTDIDAAKTRPNAAVPLATFTSRVAGCIAGAMVLQGDVSAISECNSRFRWNRCVITGLAERRAGNVRTCGCVLQVSR